MKKIALIMTLVLGLFSNSFAQKDANFISKDQFLNISFITTTPVPYQSTKYSNYNDFMQDAAPDKDKVLVSLPNESVYVMMSKLDKKGEMKYSTAAVTTSKGSYVVVYEYTKYATIPGNSTIEKIGVGLRITAKFLANGKNINVGDLYQLSLAAQQKKLYGTMNIDIIGVESGEVTSVLPFPLELNPTSVMIAMQAMEGVKTKIYDAKTRLYPQVVGTMNKTFQVGNKK